MVMDANGRPHRPKGLPKGVAGTYDANPAAGGDTDLDTSLDAGERIPDPGAGWTPCPTSLPTSSADGTGWTNTLRRAWRRGADRLEYAHSTGYDRDLGDFDDESLTLTCADGVEVFSSHGFDAAMLERAAGRARAWRDEHDRARDPRLHGPVTGMLVIMDPDGGLEISPHEDTPPRPWNPLLWGRWRDAMRLGARRVSLPAG